MKSNDRAMEKWPLFYNHLKHSSMMKTGVLRDKLREQVSKTDFYNFLNVYEKKEKIIRPTRGLIKLVEKPGFWQRRAERKRLRYQRKRLEFLRVQRIYWTLRDKASKYGQFKPFLHELNAEISMLEKNLEKK